MENERKIELCNNIDKGIQLIDDALQDLIKEGEGLPELEAAIRMELGTVFNRAFKTWCDEIQKKESGK